MPQVFKLGSYWICFWTNEGKTLLANNNSYIPDRVLRNMMRIIEARSDEIVEKWENYFGEPNYYLYLENQWDGVWRRFPLQILLIKMRGILDLSQLRKLEPVPLDLWKKDE